jgi:hypothetical protein
MSDAPGAWLWPHAALRHQGRHCRGCEARRSPGSFVGEEPRLRLLYLRFKQARLYPIRTISTQYRVIDVQVDTALLPLCHLTSKVAPQIGKPSVGLAKTKQQAVWVVNAWGRSAGR